MSDSKKEKIKQSETVIVKRSEVNFAPYNPRKQDKKVVEALKKNFKKVGFLGGIQWNVTTGNLIGGHKRLEALDLIHGYQGTNETDYDVKVEKIALDEKTEKEQNIFLNSKRVQGEMDYFALAEILPGIDFTSAGLVDFDIQTIKSMVPNFSFGDISDIQKDATDLKPKKKEKSDEEKINHVKDTKKSFKHDTGDKNRPTHFTVAFETYDEKAAFLEGIGINGDHSLITSEEFLKAMQEA